MGIKNNYAHLLLFLLFAFQQNMNAQHKVEQLTYSDFISKVWNFETHVDSVVLESNVPVIVDFYADWCGPCRMTAPILEKLQEEFKTKIQVYKVNTDKEGKLSRTMGISYLPSLLFIPKKGRAFMSTGALRESELRSMIVEKLLK